MFWKELSLQKLLEIIPIEHLTTLLSSTDPIKEQEDRISLEQDIKYLEKLTE